MTYLAYRITGNPGGLLVDLLKDREVIGQCNPNQVILHKSFKIGEEISTVSGSVHTEDLGIDEDWYFLTLDQSKSLLSNLVSQTTLDGWIKTYDKPLSLDEIFTSR
jgi:hypothetical protein